MNLSDPFGRMAKRHQMGYESMREVLRQGEIDTPEKALEVIRHSRNRTLFCLSAGGIVVLLTALLFPTALSIVLAVVVFMAVLVINWAVNGQRYVKRYIDEELKKE